MRARSLVLSAALLALAACGGPLLSAEVEVERFCYHQPTPIQIPFAPTGSPSTTVTSPTVGLPLDLPPLLRAKGSEVEVRLLEARLRPVPAGSVDLSGIQSLVVDQVLPGGNTALARYQRSGTGPITEIVAAGQGVDLAAAAQTRTLSAQLRAEGSPPTGPAGGSWPADLEVCFYGRALMPYF